MNDRMQYLARNAIVHRDLATRNLLCKREGEYYSCKVSDFGLSRSITTESNKKSEGKELLPIKWTAPEAIAEKKFSAQSDIYSFGIVLWEIFSDAKTPFEDIPNSEARKLILSGQRPKRPQNCPEGAWAIMNNCWNQDPEKRPEWKDVYLALQKLLPRDQEKEIDAQKLADANYYLESYT